jgi:galactokinase
MVETRELVAEFERRFGNRPTFLVRAPGRVNLIGEHTDYNEGYVMPLAIEPAVWIALRPRLDRRVVLVSLDFGNEGSFEIEQITNTSLDSRPTLFGGHGTDHNWLNYFAGVTWSLHQDGRPLQGWEGVVRGDVPIGAGLSSSAAVEVAAACAFAAVAGWEPEIVPTALACQRAENQWVGVGCGIMDQLVCLAGRKGHAVLIDCRSLQWQLVPLPAKLAVVIMDTATRRDLADSEYNTRRSQCEQAARELGIRALRDVSWQNWQEVECRLPEPLRRRARHVVGENHRTLQAAEALRQGDLPQLRRLLLESHRSLREDFEVSSRALDSIVEIALRQPGCWGARMTGAGFGGCAVALVEQDAVEQFVPAVKEEYQAATGLEAKLYVTEAANGAEILRPPAGMTEVSVSKST